MSNNGQANLQFIAARMAALDMKLMARILAPAARRRHVKRTRDGAQIAAEPRREYTKRK